MSVISITATESTVQRVAGIPATVTLTTNIPATIFYTLDGSDPTTQSSIAIGEITIPTDVNTVELKAFATDGVNTCPIVTFTYKSNIVSNRTPHDKITGISNTATQPSYPFGSATVEGFGVYGNTAGITVDSPDVAGIPDGFDGTGTGTYSNETDLPLSSYDFIFSETNEIGERGEGIGTLPANAKIIIPDPITPLSVATGSSDMNSALFNPRSLVMFQDNREDAFDPNVVMINRPHFGLENVETARYGNMLYTTAEEGNIPRGSALRQQFNPKENTITYYYRDADTNRWIISIVPFSPKTPDIANYSKIVFGRDSPTARVFQWKPFYYRTLI